MKNLIFTTIFIFMIISCSDKIQPDNEKILFYSSPSYYSGFKIQLDNNSKKIIASIPYEYLLADSISSNTWQFIDSLDLLSIRPFLPKEITFEIKPEESKFKELENVLKKLSKLDADESHMNDGLNIYLETENSKKVFYSPNKNSEKATLIIKTYDVVSQLFKN